MNPGPLLFLGAFFALATSWLGFVLAPQLQLGREQLVEIQETGVAYPPMRPGMARQGERVYRANGCFYCHTQQVREQLYGADVVRGWGGRAGKVQSVAQDYLQDSPVMLGSQRVGPDLANIGLRHPSANALLWHLYNPRLVATGSVMPPYRYLFTKRKLKPGEKPSAEALPSNMPGAPVDEQIIPTDDARALVAYLQSLHSDGVLFETPPPPAPPTNAVATASTNAPSTKAPATNAPATNTPARTPTNGPAK